MVSRVVQKLCSSFEEARLESRTDDHQLAFVGVHLQLFSPREAQSKRHQVHSKGTNLMHMGASPIQRILAQWAPAKTLAQIHPKEFEGLILPQGILKESRGMAFE